MAGGTFRFGGGYRKQIPDKHINIDLTYDKLSDKEMATDYADRGLELQSGEKTQLNINHQHSWWISNFRTRVRLNDFQTVKQDRQALAL